MSSLSMGFALSNSTISKIISKKARKIERKSMKTGKKRCESTILSEKSEIVEVVY